MNSSGACCVLFDTNWTHPHPIRYLLISYSTSRMNGYCLECRMVVASCEAHQIVFHRNSVIAIEAASRLNS